ncbi:MAG: SDR family oxidoreductase [Candidatus Nanopelagicales bacterium]
MSFGLDSRVYIVTAGSRGLGFAGAKFLVEQGAHVVVAARDEQVLANSIKELGGHERAVGLASDLTDPATAERLTAAAIARFGRLDGCLISSGGPPSGAAMNVTDDEWRTAFESVFLGPLRVAKAAAAAMEPHPGDVSGTCGSIVFVLSTSARVPLPSMAISNGIRPGLAAAVKDLADSLGQRGIRVNGLMPGRIATDRVFALDARNGSPERTRIKAEATIPLGRYGEPAEFAKAAGFLLSPMASYITGAVIPVDGGATPTW